ncbi:hypothetical protein EDB87DRAFT_1739157 [Lactarius vividus]|nr:hypothetical protein EDB87DRAFT_1739157 [Lactarius vividus]
MFEKPIRMNTSILPSQIPNNVACPASSRPRILEVRNYSPELGRSGTTLVIETFIFSSKQVSIRIVIGSKAIHTSVGKVQGVDDLWRCTGSVPEFGTLKNASGRTVIVSIQALEEWRVLESLSFGYFTYWEYGKLLVFLIGPHRLPPPIKPEPREATTLLDVERPRSGHRTLVDQGPRDTITQVIPAHHIASPVPFSFPKRLPRRSSSSEHGPYDKVLLDFEAEPGDLGKNLSVEEKRRRRRLVQFHCERDGNTIRISPTPVREDDDKKFRYGVVISCIWREDVRETCFTSCDLIRLLEYLVQDRFLADERSRVRRNVEHLRPITVSKTRMSKLFSTIMNLPPPKPRNIEKDVKIFKWDRLVECLNSAISKYEWVTIPSSPPTKTPTPQPAGRRTPLESLGGTMYNDINAIQHPRPYHLTAVVSPDSAAVADRSGQPNPIPAMHISPPQLHSQGVTVDSNSGGDSLTGQVDMSPAAGAGADDSSPTYSPRGTFLCFDPLGFLNLRERDVHHDMAFQFF